MSFFKKLKDKMFRSSDKIGEGLEALVAEADSPAPTPSTPPSPAPAETAPLPAADTAPKPGLLGRILGRSDAPRRVMDDAMLESLEELLIQADMGVDTAVRVTARAV